jgi:chemotaxis protein CheD
MGDISVRMGEMAVSTDPGDVLVSIGLGSCIGLALVDRKAGVCGLAHVMLPGPGEQSGRPEGTFADTGVPALLEAVQALGASRIRLAAVMVGGAQMFANAKAGTMQMGSRNEAAVLAALKQAGIAVTKAVTGGGKGRTIRVHVESATITARVAGGDDEVLYGNPLAVAA